MWCNLAKQDVAFLLAPNFATFFHIGNTPGLFMFAYQKFLIKETDRFDPSVFPQLEESLQQTLVQLAKEPAGPSTAMILTFVKDHSMHSQEVKDHPQLATLISSKSLPLAVMEQLFASSRQNLVFQSGLESYIKDYLTSGKI